MAGFRQKLLTLGCVSGLYGNLPTPGIIPVIDGNGSVSLDQFGNIGCYEKSNTFRFDRRIVVLRLIQSQSQIWPASAKTPIQQAKRRIVFFHFFQLLFQFHSGWFGNSYHA